MRVICVNNKDYPVSLTLNKKYDVVKTEGSFFIILDESLEEYIYPSDLFEVLDD